MENKIERDISIGDDLKHKINFYKARLKIFYRHLSQDGFKISFKKFF